MKTLMIPVGQRLRRVADSDLFLALAAAPILFMVILAPDTFGLSWAGFGKLGRGGLLFVIFFLFMEWLNLRKEETPNLSRARKIMIAVLVAFAILYFGCVAAVQEFTDSIYWIGRVLGASGEVSNSWLMATDYLAYGLYVGALATIFYGRRGPRVVLTAGVLSTGMLVMYLLDAFFPYGTIGPLQFWANFIVSSVGFLSGIFGLPIYGFSNNLTIVGTHGTYRLIVFWPSVGVHSMLIYSLVAVLLAVELAAPWRRKIVYLITGVLGTVFLNVTRIFIIAYYGYMYAVSGADLDAFHNSIGEFIFPLWILAFLLIVLNVESRLSARTAERTAPSEKSTVDADVGPITSQEPRKIRSYRWGVRIENAVS